MLIDIQAEQVLRACGLTGVTYFPRTAGGHLHADTARFLSSVGLPTNKFFSPSSTWTTQSACSTGRP